MILGLSCNCHAAPGLFRQFLFGGKVPNYMKVPLFKGEEAKAWVEKNNLPKIRSYIENHSSYVIVVGWTSKKDLDWVDINNADSERQIRAEMLLERFKNS